MKNVTWIRKNIWLAAIIWFSQFIKKLNSTKGITFKKHESIDSKFTLEITVERKEYIQRDYSVRVKQERESSRDNMTLINNDIWE